MSKMNKLIAIIVTLLFLPIVNAQQEDPGITPDSFLWGLDKALDQLALLLIFDEGEKAKKGLEIAQERLLEVKLMIVENKLEAAVKAKDEHGKTLIKVKQSIKEIEKDDSTEEIKELIEIEKELEKHDDDVEQTSGELKIKIKIEGEVTPQQQALIDSILNSLKGQTVEVEIEIENKKDKTKIKIKQETGKSEEEIEVEIEKLEIEAGISGIKVKAEIVGEQSEVEIEREFSTTTTDLDAIIDEIIEKFALDREIADAALEVEVEEEDEELKEKFKVKVEVEEGIAEVEVELKFILDTTDREEILDAVVERSQLTREQIENVIEFEVEEEELEIEVEIEDGIAKVEVEIGEAEWEFELDIVDLDAIIDEISARTGLSIEEINVIIDVKIKGEEIEVEEEEEESEEKEKEDKEKFEVEEDNDKEDKEKEDKDDGKDREDKDKDDDDKDDGKDREDKEDDDKE